LDLLLNNLKNNLIKYIRYLLLPFSLIYRLIVFVRNRLFDNDLLPLVEFPLPIISVGNITMGGTGKTPHVLFLAEIFSRQMLTAVLSRGYKRKTRDFIKVGVKSSVSETGDELLMIKRKLPDLLVAADRNRVKGIRRILNRRTPPGIIILDDAFQHRYVKPGLSILLVDFNRPVFRDTLFPAGNLREPLKNIKRADIIIVSKCPQKLSSADRASFISRLKIESRQEVYFTTYIYGDPLPVFPRKKHRKKHLNYPALKKSMAKILLVTGIANPSPLRTFLGESLLVYDEIIFSDHHVFTYNDIKKISRKQEGAGLVENYIFVTEKDAVRLREMDIDNKELKKKFYYIPIQVRFLAKGEKAFIRRLTEFLKKYGKSLSL